jgi:DNA-binding transcriptional LysR family regulator
MKDDRLLEMRVFRAIVENGGFTAGAHALGVSQPFASRSLARLEERIGVKLVHRSTRGLRLTEEGERYLAAGASIMAALDEAEGALSASKAEAVGDLRISAPIAFGIDQIVPRLPEFMRLHPQIKIHISLTDSLVSLIDDHIDLAIRMGRLQSSSLVSRKLCDLQRLIVAAPSYVARFGAPATPQDLAAHNCLEWQGDHDQLNHWKFKIDGAEVEFIAQGNFRSSNGLTLFAMCTEGVGIMRMAEHMALPAIRAGRLVRLLAAFEPRDQTAIHALYRPERRLLPRVRNFVDYLAALFQQPPWLVDE